MESNYPKPLNIAHRGARSLAPENTLRAAQIAFDIGADLWEFDVCLTRDSEMIVLHDDTLERTSNAAKIYPGRSPWRVSEFTLVEIQNLDFGAWFKQRDPFGQIAAGKVSSADQSHFIGVRAPTLREALEFTRDRTWKVNVEIKDLSGTQGHAIIVEKVVRLIQELRMEKDVLISSFQHEYLRQVKALAPEIRTGALVERADPDPVRLLASLNAQMYNLDVAAVIPEEIKDLRRRGIDVYVYTVNDPAVMRQLVDAQVSGIFTDFPQTLKQILESD